jgi:hypothetical protein
MVEISSCVSRFNPHSSRKDLRFFDKGLGAGKDVVPFGKGETGVAA